MTFDQLQEILRKEYHRASWVQLLREILPGTDLFADPQSISHDTPDFPASFQLGRIRIGDRNLAILEVSVGRKTNILRNRVGLRNLIARFIDQAEYHGVLAVFLSNSSDYRFTFAARHSVFDDEGNLVRKETASKRYTYVLGPNEACRTAAERFSHLANKSERATITLHDLIEAFSVERLNKEFFDTYKLHYQKFCSHLIDSDAPISIFGLKLRGLDEKKRDKELKSVRDYVKKLLGRLVFLHFLQKKGWLGCPSDATSWKNGAPDFLRQLFQTAPGAERQHFHSRRLVPLFFDTLNRERKGNIFSITGTRVPYLNGGLFERDFAGVEKIDFPTELFADVLEFFAQYNFTIDENDPEDHEIGIDPEMLGHIFENLLEDNKDKGAYYTPKAVVQYMCQQTLILALAGHFPHDTQARTSIEFLIRVKEPIDPQKDTWLAQHAVQLEKILDDLKICDPAIGSGAFPIGLLQEIFWTKLTLHPALDRAKTKRAIIQRSIHGVDLDPGAVEIARLRFWLALIVDEPEPLPLPNLDYQIMQGDSLLESFERLDLSKISQPKTIGVTLLGSDQGELGFSAKQIEIADASPLTEDLAAMQEKYFLLHDPEKKAQLRHRVDLLVLRAIDEDLERRREQLQGSLDNWHRELSRKRRAKIDYEPSPKELKVRDRMQAEIEELGAKKKKLHALLVDPRAPRPFFLWHLWFKHIIGSPPQGQGGFDIVIGNPPYVRADNSDIAEQRAAILAEKRGHQPAYVTLWEKWDLFIPFIEQGYHLLRPGGVEAMIVSDAYCHSKYSIKSQSWFLQNATVRRLDFLGKLQIFDAGVKNMIFFYERRDGANNLPERRLHTEQFGSFINLPSYRQADATHRLFFLEDQVAAHEAFYIDTVRLGSICYITKGMVVHADENVARGAFTLADLVSEVKDKDHPVRFVEAKMLDRWSALKNKWLEWGTKRAPALFSRPTFQEVYSGPEKLISIDLAAGVDHLKVAYDNTQLYHNHSVWSFVPWHYLENIRNRSLKKSARYPDEPKGDANLPDRITLEKLSQKFDAKYLVAVMNSKVARGFLMRHRRSNIHIFPDDWKPLPIAVATPEQQAPIVSVVRLLIAMLEFFKIHPHSRTARDELLISFLDAISDALVWQLYYPDQFRAKGLDAAKFVKEASLPPSKDITSEKEMDMVRKHLEICYDIKHPLRAVVFDFGSMDLVAVKEAK